MPPQPERNRMPEQAPAARRQNFDEVALGYTEELAQAEAARCLGCKQPRCVEGCPVEVDIPGFVACVKAGDYAGAIATLKDKNSLPAICGRVCPQETQCEQKCVLGRRFEPVAIGRLERFCADWERRQGIKLPSWPARNGKRVAIVGSGPAGLTCAGDLGKLGYAVTIFEAFHDTGGVLRYGIPEFRLPKQVLQEEVNYVGSLGVEIKVNAVIGRLHTVEQLLRAGYQAVFIGSGAGAPSFMGIPGENLNGVYSANEFLTRVNLMKAYRFPEYDTPVTVGGRVAVVGGGNVAMDAARTALRLGADPVFIVYRRSEKEMPARLEEVHHAQEEGIDFHLLTNPVRVLGDDRGWVRGLECVRMELGEPDGSGRRRPLPVAGSEYVLEVDTVVIAIGNIANPLVPSTTPGLETNRYGNIVADPVTGQTSLPGVYAGGDIVSGAATVIEAMGAGKRAARAIDAYLRGKDGGQQGTMGDTAARDEKG